MKQLVVLICGITAILAALVCCKTTDESNEAQRSAAETSDQAWAQAVFSSLSLSDDTTAITEHYFSEALNRSARKAPIYVSMGELGCGLSSFKQVTNSGMQKIHEATDATQLMDIAEQMVQAMDQQRGESLRIFQAAVADDPNCLEAWFHLALSEDRQLAERASAELIRIDPNNAIPFYIKAALEAEVQNLDGVTTAILQGNRVTRCRLYDLPLPTHFDLRYPFTSEYRDLGVAGKKVSPESLAYLVSINLQSGLFAPTFQSRLRSALRRIQDENGAWTLSANPKEAEEQLVVIRDMGLRLITEESRDVFVMLTGLGVANMTNQQLCDFFRSSNQPEKIEIVKALSARLLQFQQSYTADLKNEASSSDEFRHALLGRINVRGRKRARLDELIHHAGLR